MCAGGGFRVCNLCVNINIVIKTIYVFLKSAFHYRMEIIVCLKNDTLIPSSPYTPKQRAQTPFLNQPVQGLLGFLSEKLVYFPLASIRIS